MRAPRPSADDQRGLLLPVLALALAGGGALWLAAELASGVGVPGVDESRTRLLAARHALIAHASAYPESYGPTGAGPGHLVCPDTDTPLDGRSVDELPATGTAFRGDGPNPPCGDGTLAIGRLPRHVSRPGRRTAFHHERTQRFVYGVSTRYVNNPIDRVVNPESGGAPVDEIVAVIADPGRVSPPVTALAGASDPRQLLERLRAAVAREAGPRAARALPHVFLHRDDLLAAAGRRVAVWFVETATVAARRRCSAAREAGRMRGRAAKRSTARETERDEGSDEGLDGGLDGGSARMIDGRGCPPAWPDASCARGDGLEPLRWLDETVAPGCPASAEPSIGSPLAIENTPLARHWFVRNDWFRFVTLRREPGCRDLAASFSCRLRVGTGEENTLSIRLSSSGGGGRTLPIDGDQGFALPADERSTETRR